MEKRQGTLRIIPLSSSKPSLALCCPVDEVQTPRAGTQRPPTLTPGRPVHLASLGSPACPILPLTHPGVSLAEIFTAPQAPAPAAFPPQGLCTCHSQGHLDVCSPSPAPVSPSPRSLPRVPDAIQQFVLHFHRAVLYIQNKQAKNKQAVLQMIQVPTQCSLNSHTVEEKGQGGPLATRQKETLEAQKPSVTCPQSLGH